MGINEAQEFSNNISDFLYKIEPKFLERAVDIFESSINKQNSQLDKRIAGNKFAKLVSDYLMIFANMLRLNNNYELSEDTNYFKEMEVPYRMLVKFMNYMASKVSFSREHLENANLSLNLFENQTKKIKI